MHVYGFKYQNDILFHSGKKSLVRSDFFFKGQQGNLVISIITLS